MAAAKATIFFEKLSEHASLTHELVEDLFNQAFFPKKAKKASSSSKAEKSEKAKKEPNAFMLFCKQARANHTGSALTGAQLGEMWRALSESEHATYKEKAKHFSSEEAMSSSNDSEESHEPASDEEEKAAQAAPSPVKEEKVEKKKNKKETHPADEEKATEAAPSPAKEEKKKTKK